MGRRRDTTWHTAFLDLVADGATFKAAVRKLGVSPATLSEHFRNDRTFHAQAKQARGRGLHGPVTDTSWHPQLPGLLASGLSIPRAAARIGKSAITLRTHLRRYPQLRRAVEKALSEAGRPVLGLPGEPPGDRWTRRTGSGQAVHHHLPRPGPDTGPARAPNSGTDTTGPS